MIVNELLRNSDHNLVWNILENEYYSEHENKSYVRKKYHKFFNSLSKLTPKVSDTRNVLYLIKYYDEFGEDDKSIIWDTCMFSQEDETIYSLMFISWDEVMGYDVCEKSLNDYGAEAVVAHMLYELSYFGFDEKNMITEKEELDRRHKEIENGTDELISADQVFAELGYVDERTDEEKEDDIERRERLNKLNQEITDSFTMAIKSQYFR